MNEFTVKLADERGRMQEQTHAAATAEETAGARFTQAGYLVYSVKARNALGAGSTRKKGEAAVLPQSSTSSSSR